MEKKVTAYHFPTIQRKYELTLEANEVDFLGRFIAYVLDVEKESAKQHTDILLEMACIYELGRRFSARFNDPKNRKITLLPHEAIGLKRCFEHPAILFPDAVGRIYLMSIYAKLSNALGNVG